MSTKRVYYKDPYQSELETRIDQLTEDESGFWYVFDSTIFYPEGGGQSKDKGMINGLSLRNVVQQKDNIWHLLDRKISNPIKMTLDWPKRYASMQQHTGQHILSACLKKLHNLDTVSVHLGQNITMIEIDTSAVTESILESTENMANQIIRENHAVRAIWGDLPEIDEQKLRRRLKKKDGHIRLISIDNVDRVGCGGLHVSSTGEVGLIKITGYEKIRKHVRIKIKIGWAAYHYFNDLHRVFQHIGHYLTTAIGDLPEKVSQLIEDNQQLSRKVNKTNERWLSEYAKNLTSSKIPGCFYLCELSKGDLKILSEQWLMLHQRACFFISKQNSHFNFYIRIPSDLPLNAQEFIKKHHDRYAIKGGGNEEFAVGEFMSPLSDKDIDKLFTLYAKFLDLGRKI